MDTVRKISAKIWPCPTSNSFSSIPTTVINHVSNNNVSPRVLIITKTDFRVARRTDVGWRSWPDTTRIIKMECWPICRNSTFQIRNPRSRFDTLIELKSGWWRRTSESVWKDVSDYTQHQFSGPPSNFGWISHRQRLFQISPLIDSICYFLTRITRNKFLLSITQSHLSEPHSLCPFFIGFAPPSVPLFLCLAINPTCRYFTPAPTTAISSCFIQTSDSAQTGPSFAFINFLHWPSGFLCVQSKFWLGNGWVKSVSDDSHTCGKAVESGKQAERATAAFVEIELFPRLALTVMCTDGSN